ncbi:MAG TPA: HAD-IIA family hydrolase [Anaerolineaceae bacterium]|nr:HAD-IIA family hydrolase [Anaerolineaceae bacterium]
MLTDRFPELKGLILDMDGVLWKDSKPIGDLPYIFKGISDLGLKVVFATNNATKSIDEYQQKLASFGVQVEPEQIITSAIAAAKYLQQHYPSGIWVYVVGSASLKDMIHQHGFQVCDDAERNSAQVVLVAMDTSLTYEKIRNAATQIRQGADFIATNMDATFPTPQGLLPGAGACVAAIATAAEKQPLLIGKPQTLMYELAFQTLGFAPHEVMAIGDRLETDIAGAQKAGCLAGLVLSGVTDVTKAHHWQPQPDLIARDLTELIYA